MKVLGQLEQNIINRTQIDENHKDTFGLTSIEVNQNKSELLTNIVNDRTNSSKNEEQNQSRWPIS